MAILIHPTYFPSIAHFVAMVKADTVVFEMADNFQKQTLRNRTYIYAANGRLLLNVPVVYTQKNRQRYREVKVFNDENWQRNHWKSLLSAYSTSPFFEFYSDELAPLFKKEFTNLMELNLETIRLICDCLQLDLNVAETTDFEKDVQDKTDLRALVNAKLEQPKFDAYQQVFSEKHGFINNLSILDLLFNEGPNTLNYLQSQSLNV
ncbi:MAG: WbqC family protein [Algicola sp.]|nr:WbqC family protein [Algicola sp.]